MGGIEDSMKETGKIMGGIPHIVIGKNKDKNRDMSPFKAWKGQSNYNGQQTYARDPVDVNIEKAKKWGLLIAVAVIASYAAYRILTVIF